jgi:hypothetical protein
MQVNAGFGVSGWGVPIYVGADYGVYDLEGNLGNITAGGELSYRHWNYSNYYKYSIIGISVNGNWHFGELINMPSKVDTYAGLSLGYTIWSANHEGLSYGSGLYFAGQAGARYFFTDKLGAQIEAGGGTVSGLKLGITYKL